MPMQFTQIKETCLYIRDLDRAKSFYHEILGMPLISKVEGRHIFFRCGTSVLLCFIPEITEKETRLPPHYAKGKQHIAFECKKKEYLAWRGKLENAGIEILQEITWESGRKSFYFHDPEGHVLEIIEPGVWES